MMRFLRWLFRRPKITHSNPYALDELKPGEGAVTLIRRGDDGSEVHERIGSWLTLKPGEDIDTPRDPSTLTITSWIRKHL
jgi:hypothetical protein